MNLTIREAKKEDMPGVLDLIKELAIYEKEPDAVVVTVNELVKDGFGENPQFYVIVADNFFYYFKYSTWKGRCLYLEDLVVKQKARRDGVGTKLFEQLMKVAHDEKVKRMEWQVLDWNEPAINFYKKYPTSFETNWENCQFFEEDLQAFFKSEA